MHPQYLRHVLNYVSKITGFMTEHLFILWLKFIFWVGNTLISSPNYWIAVQQLQFCSCILTWLVMACKHTSVWKKPFPSSGNRLFRFFSSEVVRGWEWFCASPFFFCFRGPGGGRPWPNPTNANSVSKCYKYIWHLPVFREASSCQAQHCHNIKAVLASCMNSSVWYFSGRQKVFISIQGSYIISSEMSIFGTCRWIRWVWLALLKSSSWFFHFWLLNSVSEILQFSFARSRLKWKFLNW